MNLQDIYNCKPCEDRWDHLLAGIESYQDTASRFPAGFLLSQEISLGDVAVINGASDAIWCIRAMNWKDIAVRRKFISRVLSPACKRVSRYTGDSQIDISLKDLQYWCAGNKNIDLVGLYEPARPMSRVLAWAVWLSNVRLAVATEREHQRRDIIAAYPPLLFLP